MAAASNGKFLHPSAVERVFNRAFGWIVGRGFGPRNSYLLEVAGRKSGRIFATPVNVLVIGWRTFLVCPRGRAQWVRNAEASGFVSLRRGHERVRYALRKMGDGEKPEILRTYLDRFKLSVKRYFPVNPGSSASAFEPIASCYAVFELTAAGKG